MNTINTLKIKTHILISFLGLFIFAGLFFMNKDNTYAATTLYVYKDGVTNNSATVYTTFGPTPVYKFTLANWYSMGSASISAVAITPNSTSIDDTNVTLTFYKDTDNNGEVSSGDINLGGSGAFSADNTKTTFTFTSLLTIAAAGQESILVVANGTGVNTNTFNATIPIVSDFTCVDDDNACSVMESYGGIGASLTTLTVLSPAPSITAANGSNNPTTIYLGPTSGAAVIQQLAFVNSSATADIITSIQITPTGTVEENIDYTLKIWKESSSGTMGIVDTYDSQLLLSSSAWLNNSNGTTTFTILGGGLRIDGSATTNFLFGVAGAGSALGGKTHAHQVPISGITEVSGTNVTLAGGQSDPLTSATGTVDTTAPTISAVYSAGQGWSGVVDVTFSEPMDDSTFVASDFELDSDSSNDGVNEYAGSSGSTTITCPSVDSDSNDEYYNISASGPAITGFVYLHVNVSSFKDRAGNGVQACNACGTEYDAAQPAISDIVGATDTNGRNKFTYTFTENIFLDNTNQDGTLDSGDTTNGESTTSTSSFGAFGQTISSTYWIIEGLFKVFNTGDVTQPVETCNTLGVSGAILTVTFNTVAECYFSGTSWPNVSSIGYIDDGATQNIFLYAIEGYNLATRKFPTDSKKYLMGDQISTWDKTAPSTVTAGAGTSTSTTITPTWTAITDAKFGEYIIAYKTTPAVTIANGTLWSSAVGDDPTLATATKSSTTITGLTANTAYHYVVYARDTAGNLSTASLEKIVTTSAGTSNVYYATPAAPTNVALTQVSNGVKITWKDSTATDLANTLILRGKNGPVLGETYGSKAKGVQEYIDTDIKDGDVIKYILKAKSTNNVVSNGTTEVSITVKLDTTPPAVSKIEASDCTELVVTFSENIDPASAKIETFSVKDDKGNKLELKSLSVSGDKVILVTAPQTLGKTYTLKVPTFENLVDPILDLSGNAMEEVHTETFKGVPAAEFTDVTLADHGWAMDAINWARETGYVSGRSKGIFAPGSKLVRSELAAMIAKIMLPEGEKDLSPDGKSSFQDILPEMWDTPYINYLYNAGITKGRQPGFFVPMGYTYRAEMISMLVRWLETLSPFKSKISEITTEIGLGLWENSYADVEAGTWYERTMAVATYYGIVEGKETGGKKYASPLGKVTRAEAVVMLKKTADLLNK